MNSTNSYDDGVGIQASRFNHSCSPNAEFEWDESISASGIRTVSKIYYNQEITVNYRPEEIRSSMKKSMELDFKLYQKWILRKIVFLKALPLEWKEMVFCYQNRSSDREKLLKFEAEGREFAKILRSLEQFIQTVKGQNNFW